MKRDSGQPKEEKYDEVGQVTVRLWKPKAILFGFVLFYLIVRLISAIRWRENPFISATGWNPVFAVTEPLLLLVGAGCLLIDRSWSHLLTILLAGKMIYSNGYLGLVGISYAHGTPMFGLTAIRLWFKLMSTPRIINMVLALILLIVSVILLSRKIGRSSPDTSATAKSSTTG